jgi:hypothetical protein
MRYQLFYGEVHLGDVTEEDADFPNLSGTFQPSDASDHPEIRRRVGEYVEYSIAADRLIDEPDGYDTFVEEHEDQFLDLIESEDWWLEDERGERSSILVPNFCRDSGLVWRWNPGTEGHREPDPSA